VVTGASGGIGWEVARGLAGKGAQVVLAVRSIERGQSAASAILCASSGASVEVMPLDLADLASVHRFADAHLPRTDSTCRPSIDQQAAQFPGVRGSRLAHGPCADVAAEGVAVMTWRPVP
jgi:NAD(P)-dependent dehydrogenase (short-subunit alcohol dehydrogenase family)